MKSNNVWSDKIASLCKKHNLGYLVNPGGAQFVNNAKHIDIQVLAYDDEEDYHTLFKALVSIGLEE